MHVVMKLLNQLLELRHPTDSQVAVLKEYPPSLLRVIHRHIIGFLALTLAE
jgi:hypothetical protein